MNPPSPSLKKLGAKIAGKPAIGRPEQKREVHVGRGVVTAKHTDGSLTVKMQAAPTAVRITAVHGISVTVGTVVWYLTWGTRSLVIGKPRLTGGGGTPGPPGLIWKTTYTAALTYAKTDAVYHNGSAYISLVNTNTGHTPASSPTQWHLLAEKGASGTPGPTGLPGLVWKGVYTGTITYGAVTVVYHTGSSYLSLSSGNVGNIPAATGTAHWELVVKKGAVGASGAPGMVWDNTYTATITYSETDVVYHTGSSYISLVNSNKGHTPFIPTTVPITLYVSDTLTGSTAKLSTSGSTPATLTHVGRSFLPGSPRWWVIGLGASTSVDSTTPPAPSGHGARWVVSTLGGKTMEAGTYTFTIPVRSSTLTTVTAARARVWKYNSSTHAYTSIGTLPAATLHNLTTSFQLFTFTASLAASTFGPTTQLYIDLLFRGHSIGTVVYVSTGSTNAKLITPGYSSSSAYWHLVAEKGAAGSVGPAGPVSNVPLVVATGDTFTIATNTQVTASNVITLEGDATIVIEGTGVLSFVY